MKNLTQDVLFGFVLSQPANRVIKMDECMNYGQHVGDMMVQFGRIHFEPKLNFFTGSLNGFYNMAGDFLCGVDGPEFKGFMRICYDRNIKCYGEAQGILQDMLAHDIV